MTTHPYTQEGCPPVAYQLGDIEEFFARKPEFRGRAVALLARVQKNTQGGHIAVDDLKMILDPDIWLELALEVRAVPFNVDGMPYDDPHPELAQ